MSMGARFITTLFYLALCSFWTSADAQVTADSTVGSVTFKTSQNIYVRFASTRGIQPGDTLYTEAGDKGRPVVVVTQTSSTSCVGLPLAGAILDVGTPLYVRRFAAPEPETMPDTPVAVVLPPEAAPVQPLDEAVPVSASDVSETTGFSGPSRITGRISAATYINISDQPGGDIQRMRYTLSMTATHEGDRGLSMEVFTTFRHTIGEWAEVQQQFSQAFKVYSLAAQYDVNRQTHLWLGRKINLNLANLGAIDGLQAETGRGDFFGGAFAGSRPDHFDYGFNPDLLQYGAYIGHRKQGLRGQLSSTIAFAEQRNQGATDRRYLYLQHSSSPLKDVQLFASAEFDLYTLDTQQVRQGVKFTSAFFSLRYRVSDALSLYGSFDARRNIVFYETYRSFLDQFIDDQTRQGLRFNITWRPARRITVGASLGSRFEANLPPTRNLNSYLTFARTPVLGLSASLSAVWIETSYLTGSVIGMRIYRDVLKGKVYTELQYRRARYRYGGGETTLDQHIAGLNVSWRIRKKLSLAVNFEGEFQSSRTLARIYGNMVQRF